VHRRGEADFYGSDLFWDAEHAQHAAIADACQCK